MRKRGRRKGHAKDAPENPSSANSFLGNARVAACTADNRRRRLEDTSRHPNGSVAKPESGRHTHDIYPAGATLLRPGDLWRKHRLRRNSRRGRFRLMRRGYGSQRFRQRRHESDVERPGRFAQDLSPLYVSSALGSYPGVSVLFPRLFARLSDPDLRVSSGASRRVRMSAKPALLSGPFVGHVRRHLVSHPGRGASL